MRGQWIRTISENPLAVGILDIDDLGDRYEGSAVIYYGADKPTFVVRKFQTKDKATKQRIIDADVIWCAGGNPVSLSDEQLREIAPGWSDTFARKVDLTLELQGEDLLVAWETDNQNSGQVLVAKSDSGRPSELVPEPVAKSWEDFKEFALTLPSSVVFRGQADAHWRLRTHFHRTGRSNLIRYVESDVPEMHGALSSQTRHYFQMGDEVEYGSFVHLLQHHGFPTPLLDWTKSPFVAAYFAFADRPPSGLSSPRTHCWILAFDAGRWIHSHRRARSFAYVGPHLSMLSAVAIDNPRTAPQQSLSSYTNVDDLETFIDVVTETNEPPYLRAIDLPLSARHQALRELELMGITPASLFPGIEGVCRAKKASLFGFDA